MSREQRAIDLGDTVKTYVAQVKCENCDYAGEAAIPKGTIVSGGECPRCGCVSLRKIVKDALAPQSNTGSQIRFRDMVNLIEEHQSQTRTYVPPTPNSAMWHIINPHNAAPLPAHPGWSAEADRALAPPVQFRNDWGGGANWSDLQEALLRPAPADGVYIQGNTSVDALRNNAVGNNTFKEFAGNSSPR